MSLIGTTLELRGAPIAGARACRPSTLARACFDQFVRSMRAPLRGQADLLADLATYAQWLREPGREAFTGEVAEIQFWSECSFPWGLTGDVVAHWFALVYAQSRGAFAALAAKKGWSIAPAVPSLASQLRLGPRDPMRWRGDRLWKIWRYAGDEPEYTIEPVATERDVPPPELDDAEREVMRAAWLAGWCECPLCQAARTSVGAAEAFDPAGVLAAWRCLQDAPQGLLRAAGEAALAWDDERWATTPAGPTALDGLRERLVACGSAAPGPAMLASLVMRAARYADE